MRHLSTLILGLTFLIFATSCKKDNNCISGSGSNTSRTYNLSSFDKLAIYGVAEVQITKSSTQSVRVEGQQNILNDLNVSVNSSQLSVGENNCFENLNTLKIFISVPSLMGIKTSGVCTVISPDSFTENEFAVNISGISNMSLNLNVQDFSLNNSGDGNVSISGNAANQMYTTEGEFNASCFGLVSEHADIDASGITNMEVNVSNTLKVKMSGSGTIYYKGTPSINSNISGSGTIVDAN